jgi:CRISPR-associated endonuclease/helicase Cas3
MNRYYAHSTEDRSKSDWQPLAHVSEDGRFHLLEHHLLETAHCAAQMAAEFGASEWAYLAGLWHDLGKYSPAFQSMIRTASGLDANIETKTGRVDHSTAGCVHAMKQFGCIGRVVAYIIGGHHAGLPDWQGESSGMGDLVRRLTKDNLHNAMLSGHPPKNLLGKSLPLERPRSGTDLSASMWIRMLYSCVVDADFLDTERFFDPAKADSRGGYPDLSALLDQFGIFMEEKVANALDTSVNQMRRKVLDRCMETAIWPPGAFSLTVPTGGGKTLSSMAFSMRHAVVHRKRRVIYVIPYTSIIEQTADQFRDIFGDSVIEHHSNLDVSEDQETSRSRLASENWDAPIIVTTSVQFFESLFAARSSRCRKLHNIVNSVVVLDEAQLLPPDFLIPILEALDELRKNYGVTIVFCTATQPAFSPRKTPDFRFKGMTGINEIVEDPSVLHKGLKRVEISIPPDLTAPCSWEIVAESLQRYQTVLCIVNRRDDARMLWSLMPNGTYHLSALMCGAHRSSKIKEIRQRLKDGFPTRVISTQLVEAGVDLDFPFVWRALAGLDSIAQAAGRCNREGLLKKGEVHVFVPPTQSPAGQLRQAAEIGRRLLASDANDPIRPERFEMFFREFYWLRGDRLDAKGTMADLRNDAEMRIGFRSAASRFHLIDEAAYTPVIVQYNNQENIDLLHKVGPERWLMRRFQRFVVNLPNRIHAGLMTVGAIIEVHPGVFLQSHPSFYDDNLGFRPDASIVYETDDLVI